jgi:hypothetical protein
VRRFAGLLAALSLMVTARAPAQLAPAGAPKGTFRVDLRGSFGSADRRLFEGTSEDYLADFGSPALGSDRIPLLSATDALVGAIIGQPSYRLNLGHQRARGQLTIGTGTIGGALGLTRRLTLFANVPFVTSRVQANLRLDSTASDAGLNPAHPVFGNTIDQGIAAQFVQDFSSALSELADSINSGAYAGNPGLDATARALLARGTTVRDQLSLLSNDPTAASPFLPTATSGAGAAILAVIAGLQDTLASQLSVPGFNSAPVLPASRATQTDLQSFVAAPAGPVAALPLFESKISRMGDMDLGAIYTVIDRFDRPGETGGLRVALQGLLRLPTGRRDDPNNLTDVGTGNGRYEIGLSGLADLGRGRWGARLSGGYLIRLSSFRVRRITAPGQPYAAFTTLGNVRLNAGDVAHLGARPFFRLARNLALHGVADYWRAGRDEARYESASDSLPGIDAGILGEDGRSALSLGGGITYVGRGARECQPGRKCGLPIEASWSYTTVASASGQPVSKFRTTRLEIRWYQRIWR